MSQDTDDFCMPFPSRCIKKLAGSPDHLGCLEEEQWGDRDAEGLGGLEVDDEIELHGLDHGQIGRLGALEHPAGIDTQLTIRLVNTGAIAHQAARGGKAFRGTDGGHRVASRKRQDFRRIDGIQGVGVDEQRRNLVLRECCKRRIDVACGAGGDDDQCVPQRLRRCLRIADGGLVRWIVTVQVVKT